MVRLWKMLKHRDIRLVNNENRRSKIESDPNYNGTKYISEYIF